MGCTNNKYDVLDSVFYCNTGYSNNVKKYDMLNLSLEKDYNKIRVFFINYKPYLRFSIFCNIKIINISICITITDEKNNTFRSTCLTCDYNMENKYKEYTLYIDNYKNFIKPYNFYILSFDFINFEYKDCDNYGNIKVTHYLKNRDKFEYYNEGVINMIELLKFEFYYLKNCVILI